MKKRYKRAFIGYKIDNVQRFMEQEEDELRDETFKYNKELSKLAKENDTLKKELNDLLLEMKDYKEIRVKLEKALYDNYMRICKNVYDEESKFNEMLSYKSEVIKKQREKNSKVKEIIDNLMNQLHSIKE